MLPFLTFHSTMKEHFFTFVYFPTWVIIVYNLWSTNNIEKETVKSTDIWKYLQYLKWTHLQQYIAAQAKSRCAWQQSKGKTTNGKYVLKTRQTFFLQIIQVFYFFQTGASQRLNQDKSFGFCVNFHWWPDKMPNIWGKFCFYCDWNTVRSLLNQVVL